MNVCSHREREHFLAYSRFYHHTISLPSTRRKSPFYCHKYTSRASPVHSIFELSKQTKNTT